MFWVDSRLLEVVKIERWSHIEVGQCRLFFSVWMLASNAGDFRGVLISSLPTNACTSSPKNACVGGYWGVSSLLERKNHEIISLTFRTNEVEEVEVQLFKFIDLHKLQIKLRKLKVEVY